MKIYCEHGALTDELRAFQREGKIELVHFPYDPESRARAIAPSAVVSNAQWRDLNVKGWDDLGRTWGDFAGSEHLEKIKRIIGPENRRDALHVDSAYKTGCAAIVTVDNDILDHKDELEALLGLRVFHPQRDQAELRGFIADRAGEEAPPPKPASAETELRAKDPRLDGLRHPAAGPPAHGEARPRTWDAAHADPHW